jgi:hypothetical protein
VKLDKGQRRTYRKGGERQGRLRVASAFLALAAVSSAAFAQTLTCNDVAFRPSTVERFPSVAQSCNSVVERDGKLYVRLVAEVIRAKSGLVLLYLKGPDGSRIKQEFKPPPGFLAMISGKPTPLGHLRRGQEIHLYLPESDWQVVDAPGRE